ncbi:MAG: hypothetical protein GX565_04545, partial [Lentisphaerae bacterium]|nr:hypothetical protein [Lentisphaerota bacterium]
CDGDLARGEPGDGRVFTQRRGDAVAQGFYPHLCDHWVVAKSGPGERVMRVIEALERANIESRPVWKPMHLQPVFEGARVIGGAVSEHLFANGLCLPSGTGLERDDVARICDVVVASLAT